MLRPSDMPTDADRLLTEAEAAKLLGLRPATLGYWRRRRGLGPRCLRHGRKRLRPVRYRLDDVLKFRAARSANLEK